MHPHLTHPPLSHEQFQALARIAPVREDLQLALREIERLKALERVVWQALQSKDPPGSPERQRLRQELLRAIEGDLGDARQFGLALPTRARRAQAIEQTPPMNYRGRGEVVAAEAAARAAAARSTDG